MEIFELSQEAGLVLGGSLDGVGKMHRFVKRTLKRDEMSVTKVKLPCGLYYGTARTAT